MFAGFAQEEISPRAGTLKIGTLGNVRPEKLLDPLHARAAAFEHQGGVVGFIQLDTLSVRWTQADEIRRRIRSRCGIPTEGVMVAATHNHAGPATAKAGTAPRDEAYLESMVEKAAEAFRVAFTTRERCEIGYGSIAIADISFNRRMVMRDGTVKTNATFQDAEALFVEGPVDPYLHVMSVRSAAGKHLGVIVNYACHAVHHGRDPVFSAGYPGVLADDMRARGVPVSLFLQGSAGNVSSRNPVTGQGRTKEEVGRFLAHAVLDVLSGMSHVEADVACARTQMLKLSYREPTEAEIAGRTRGAQRIGGDSFYEPAIQELLGRIAARQWQPADLQVLRVGDIAFVGIPAEFFAELGLKIKEKCHPYRVLVVTHANGMVGYVPTADAFARGGYETTFAPWSRMSVATGEEIVEAAGDLVRGLFS